MESKGILGLGRVSTLFYVNEIHRQFQEIHGGYATCPFILYQINFNEINPFLPSQLDILVPKVQEYFHRIQDLGITKLLIPNITLHETVDQVSTNLEILHAVQLTIQKLKNLNVKRVVVFGTIFTMNSQYLADRFKKENIILTFPHQKDQQFIDAFRMVVNEDKHTKADVQKFHALCAAYAENTALIIACTELSVAAVTGKNIFDMVQIQIEAFLI